MRIEIKKVWEGRMGFNLTPTFEIYLDGELVGFNKRRWLAEQIGNAVVDGRIPATGDTTAAFEKWAFVNAPEVFNRLDK